MSYITVPEITLPNGTTVPSFRVAQYAMGKDDDGKAISCPDRKPWHSIDYHEARQACADIGGALITEMQWLAIAHDVANQDCNWTGGKVGEGDLFQGIRNWNVNEAQAGDFEPSDETERRWLTLSNGERICDLNGNIFQWIFDDLQGDEDGLVAKAFAHDSISIQAPYPSMKKGMGWIPDSGANWSGGALIRGGYWYSGSYAGAFGLGGGWPGSRYSSVGFRCTMGL